MRPNLNHAISASALTALVLLAPPAAAQKPESGRVVLLDRIAVVINDEVITRRDLDERVRIVQLQMRQQGTPLPPRDVLEKQVLERIIYARVQLQYAKETGLRVDDA